MDDLQSRELNKAVRALAEAQREAIREVGFKLHKELRKTRRQLVKILTRIADEIKPHLYQIKIKIKGASMSIVAGGTGTFDLTLFDNGAPFVPPAGSTYVFSPTLVADDPSASVSQGSSPTQFIVSIPGSDTATTVNLTGSATDPQGGTATGTLAVTVTPEPQQFTVNIVQSA